MQFTIISQKSSLVKYFFQKNRIFFDFEKNRQKLRPTAEEGRHISVPSRGKLRILRKKVPSLPTFFNFSAEILFTNCKKYDILL